MDSGLRESGIYPYYGATGIIDYVKDYIFDGEYVLLGEDGANIITRNSPLVYVTQGKFWLNNHAHIMQSNTGSNIFLAQLLENVNYERYNSGTAQPKLNAQVVKKLQLNFPKSKEQTKIGAFFSTIDNTIALHQRKLDSLKELKKAYLQQMFPQNNSNIPRLRFANFNLDWEQRKLGDVIEGMYNGQTPSRANDSFWNGDINWLSSGELNRGIVSETIEKITPAGQENSNLRVVEKGSFIMAITGLEAAGTRGNCALLGIDTTLNQSCMALYPKKELLTHHFLYQWYRKVGEEYGINYTQGTKQQSYNAEIIKILPINLPKITEQKKISEFLESLDTTIALHQHKLDSLKKFKNAYLQKMFI